MLAQRVDPSQRDEFLRLLRAPLNRNPMHVDQAEVDEEMRLFRAAESAQHSAISG